MEQARTKKEDKKTEVRLRLDPETKAKVLIIKGKEALKGNRLDFPGTCEKIIKDATKHVS